jgi:hypothetical protein
MTKGPIGIFLMLLMFLTPLSGCVGTSNLANDLFENRGIPGGLALACLDDSSYTRLVIEIDYEEGFKPETSSTDMLVDRLESVCDKPNGVDVKLTSTNFNHDGSWDADDVREKGLGGKGRRTKRRDRS